MDTGFQDANKIPTHPLASPVPVFLADGATSPAGFITKETIPLVININGHTKQSYLRSFGSHIYSW
jgi:hypothetical protein